MTKRISILTVAFILIAAFSPVKFNGLAADDKAEYAVIVELDKTPTADGITLMSREYKSIKAMTESVSQYVDVNPDYVYTHAFSGFSCMADSKKIQELESTAGVKKVYISRRYEVPRPEETTPEIYEVKHGRFIETMSQNGYDGRNTAIAILDSEFELSHPHYSLNEALGVKFIKDDIDNIKGDFGLGETDVYYNAKIPYAYDYVGRDTDLSISGQGHGTHVAGIAAGKEVNFQNGDTVKGVAPQAQLVLMKVFSDEGSADDTDILAALDHAVQLGVDAINLSLGTSYGFSGDYHTLLYDNIFAAAREKGILISCSAGNNGVFGGGNVFENNKPLTENPDYGTIASPATSKNSTTVAAGDNTGSTWSIWDSSSRGTTPNLQLKPEVSAEGARILSSYPGGGYAYMWGTSMAAPHIAGAAAVLTQYIKEEYPSLTPAERLKAAETLMMSTSEIMERDGTPLSPRAQGSGLLNLTNALSSPAVLMCDGGSPKIELGHKIENSFTLSFTAKNLSDNTLSYNLSADVVTDGYETFMAQPFISQSPAKMEGTSTLFAEGDILTLGPNEEKTVIAQVTLDPSTVADLEAVFKNGFFVEGFVRLESENNPDLSIPFMGYRGNWNTLQAFDGAVAFGGGSFGKTNIFMQVGGNWFAMGKNPYIADSIPQSKYVALKPGSSVKANLALLRNITTLHARILNSNGEVVHTVSNIDTWLLKAYKDKTTSALNTYEENLLLPQDTESLPDGNYTLQLVGAGEYEGADEEPSVYNFPFVLDSQLPMLEKAYIVFDGEKRYFEAEIKDNHAVAFVRIFKRSTGEFFDEKVTLGSEVGQTQVVRFDITDLDEKAIDINLFDYAQNGLALRILMKKAYVALYDENNTLLDFFRELAPVDQESGKTSMKFENIPPEVKKIRVFRWDGAYEFLTNPYKVLVGEN